MTTDPDDKVRRPMVVPTDAPHSAKLGGAREGDEPVAPDSDIDGPRRSRGSLSGSMPAIRGPRDRGRRH